MCCLIDQFSLTLILMETPTPLRDLIRELTDAGMIVKADSAPQYERARPADKIMPRLFSERAKRSKHAYFEKLRQIMIPGTPVCYGAKAVTLFRESLDWRHLSGIVIENDSAMLRVQWSNGEVRLNHVSYLMIIPAEHPAIIF